MSFEPDDIDHDIDVRTLLHRILIELKKIRFVLAEASDLKVTDEDVQ